mgnify:CR=1 FL=1
MEEHESHGHSLAAWTGVGILLVAFLLGSVAVAMSSKPLAIVAAVIGVIGVIAGIVLKKAGHGVEKPAAHAPTASGAYAADKR